MESTKVESFEKIIEPHMPCPTCGHKDCLYYLNGFCSACMECLDNQNKEKKQPEEENEK